jgi:hypothetical protein
MHMKNLHKRFPGNAGVVRSVLWMVAGLLLVLLAAWLLLPADGAQAQPQSPLSPLPVPVMSYCVRTDTEAGYTLACLYEETPTPTATSTPLPTSTPVPTSTPAPSATPAQPYPWGWWGDKAGFTIAARDIAVTGGGAILASPYLYINQAAEMTIKQVDPASNELGLVLLSRNSAAASGDMIVAKFVPSRGVLRIQARAAGRWWNMGDDVPAELSPGQRVRAQLVDDVVAVYVDDRLIVDRLMDPWRFDPTSGGWAGLLSDNASHIVTDFAVTALP